MFQVSHSKFGKPSKMALMNEAIKNNIKNNHPPDKALALLEEKKQMAIEKCQMLADELLKTQTEAEEAIAYFTKRVEQIDFIGALETETKKIKEQVQEVHQANEDLNGTLVLTQQQLSKKYSQFNLLQKQSNLLIEQIQKKAHSNPFLDIVGQLCEQAFEKTTGLS